jgi:hypothetical protein
VFSSVPPGDGSTIRYCESRGRGSELVLGTGETLPERPALGPNHRHSLQGISVWAVSTVSAPSAPLCSAPRRRNCRPQKRHICGQPVLPCDRRRSLLRSSDEPRRQLFYKPGRLPSSASRRQSNSEPERRPSSVPEGVASSEPELRPSSEPWSVGPVLCPRVWLVLNRSVGPVLCPRVWLVLNRSVDPVLRQRVWLVLKSYLHPSSAPSVRACSTKPTRT